MKEGNFNVPYAPIGGYQGAMGLGGNFHTSGDSPALSLNEEGGPGWVPYVDDEGRDKYYTQDVIGAGTSHYNVLNPRTPLLDQGVREKSDLSSGMSEEGDKGLLDQNDHFIDYVDNEGLEKKFRELGVVTSVHRGKTVTCLKNCDEERNTTLTPVGTFEAAPSSDDWPQMTSRSIKAESESDTDDMDSEAPTTEVEAETNKLGRDLADLRRTTQVKADDEHEEQLSKLDDSHASALEALDLAKKVADDQVEEIDLKHSIKDLQWQLNASSEALDYAQKDDFSYVGKIPPGGQEGNLERLYKDEDPLLLASIRRGDFVRAGPNGEVEPYVDSQGNEISDENLEKLKKKTGDDLEVRRPCCLFAAPSSYSAPSS